MIALKHMQKDKGVKQTAWNPGRNYLESGTKEESPNCHLIMS